MNAMPPQSELSTRLELALQIARGAGERTLGYYQRNNFTVERKRDNSPVTLADREAEAYLREAIRAAFPRDAILGEELGEIPGDSGYRWILDPIDGTKSFIHGVPLYTTLIGLEYQNRSVLGTILAPALDEMVYAAVGSGAWYVRGNEQPVRARVSTASRLDESLVLTSEMATFGRRTPAAIDVWLKLSDASRLARTWGDAYGYMMVAIGRAEAMIDPQMSLWDAAALQPILEEAGGTFTNWQGEPTIYSEEGIATNGLVLNQVLDFTRDR